MSSSVVDCPTCFQKSIPPRGAGTANSPFILTGTRYGERKTSTVSNAGGAKTPQSGIRTPPLAVKRTEVTPPVESKKISLKPILLGVAVLAFVGAGILIFKARPGARNSLESSAVFHFSFDNVFGKTVPNTGTGGSALDGTLVGDGARISAAGRFGKALLITDTGTGATQASDIVLVHSRILNTDAKGFWTLAYWIKTTTPGAGILYQGNGLWASPGQTTFYLKQGKAAGVRHSSGWLIGSAALNDGFWHHVAIVDTGGTFKIYVDGTEDSVSSAWDKGPLSSDANQTWIGGSPDGVGDGVYKMNGYIDEVWMFDHPLGKNEIVALMTTND